MDIKYLKDISLEVRKNIIKMMYNAGSGHIGGSLSCVELLVSLFFKELKISVNNPEDNNRDRFILSKGHSAAALYSVLARKGFFNEDILFNSFIDCNGILQEHTDRVNIPGVDMSTGSLGQGLSVGAGMALAAKKIGKEYRTYVIVGCGECQEGQIWEAAMFASHYKLDNLCVFVDYNKLQVCGKNSEIMSVEPLRDKWESFNWDVQEIDGHNFQDIFISLENARKNKNMSSVIIANTIKGKGITFMENKFEWHAGKITKDIYEEAKKVLI